MEIEICIELHFTEKKTGMAYTDATAKTIKEAEELILRQARKGWICAGKSIGVYEHAGLFEQREIANMRIA